MSTVESYAQQEIKKIIPNCEKLEVEIYVDDVSYSIDFFATINGKRKQCLDMIDEGLIKEEAFDNAAKLIAEYARNTADFKKGEVNKYFT